MKRFILMGVLALGMAVSGTAIAADGAGIYKAKCAPCHGPDGQGTAMAPAFKGNEFIKKSDDATITATIKNGRAGAEKHYKQFAMAMPKQTLNDDEVKAVIGQLRTLAGK